MRGSLQPRAHALLGEVLADPNAPPEVRDAAQAAIAAVERQRRMLNLAANLYQGISLGPILLLAAIGLASPSASSTWPHGEMLVVAVRNASLAAGSGP